MINQGDFVTVTKINGKKVDGHLNQILKEGIVVGRCFIHSSEILKVRGEYESTVFERVFEKTQIPH